MKKENITIIFVYFRCFNEINYIFDSSPKKTDEEGINDFLNFNYYFTNEETTEINNRIK